MHLVALLTPSHRKDLDRFALLCEGVDRYVTGQTRHYVVVNDDDIPLFSSFASERRAILPASKFLPRWLLSVPRFLTLKGRRLWWSFGGGYVHGWHVQQLLKIGAVNTLPEERYCIVDSDNVFFRPFDVAAYAGAETTPLYYEPGAIAGDSPLHAKWTRVASALLGLAEPAFPADDYIGNALVWDQATARAMTEQIERVTGKSWQAALCRARDFSEYILYGTFSRSAPQIAARHAPFTEGLAVAHWDANALDRAELLKMVADAPAGKVALCIESFSKTNVDFIREAAGLSRQ